MPRYEADYGQYDREYGRRFGGYRRRYASDYDRPYDRGWGMTGLYNRIMRGAPRRRRPYDPDFQGGRRYRRYGAEYGRRPPPRRYDRELHGVRARGYDRGSIGVHHRGYDRRWF
jgi:hypothetical protein